MVLLFMVWPPEEMLELEAGSMNNSNIYIISHITKLTCTSRLAVRKQRQNSDQKNSDPSSLI